MLSQHGAATNQILNQQKQFSKMRIHPYSNQNTNKIQMKTTQELESIRSYQKFKTA